MIFDKLRIAESESGSDDTNGVPHDDIASDVLEERDSSASSQHNRLVELLSQYHLTFLTTCCATDV